MNQEFNNPTPVVPVFELDTETRGTFIARTYAHLFGAIMAFTGLEVLFFKTGASDSIMKLLASAGNRSWLLVLGGFMLISWFARRTASTAPSRMAQYLALSAYVAAWSVLFVPILWIADEFAPGAIQSAAVTTILGFAGLTCIAFGTRKDFSFLRGILMWVGLSAFIAIIAAVIFGFELGTWFSVAMVAFAGAAILYDTSNVIHHYPRDRYVGASLELFASVALMFWYLLRLFSSRN
ncbi:MAG: US12 family protein [Phycisphaerae bacterium]|nr:US12 family protein [Phycisphaerae bacterium]